MLLSIRAMLDIPANACAYVPDSSADNESQVLQLCDNETPVIIREATRSVNRDPECGLTEPTISGPILYVWRTPDP
jgi:hypothetical protein